MIKVNMEVFETEDGQIFKLKVDAIKHESKIGKEKCKEELFNLVQKIYYCDIDDEDLTEGILKYSDELIDILTRLKRYK